MITNDIPLFSITCNPYGGVSESSFFSIFILMFVYLSLKEYIRRNDFYKVDEIVCHEEFLSYLIPLKLKVLLITKKRTLWVHHQDETQLCIPFHHVKNGIMCSLSSKLVDSKTEILFKNFFKLSQTWNHLKTSWMRKDYRPVIHKYKLPSVWYAFGLMWKLWKYLCDIYNNYGSWIGRYTQYKSMNI